MTKSPKMPLQGFHPPQKAERNSTYTKEGAPNSRAERRAAARAERRPRSPQK